MTDNLKMYCIFSRESLKKINGIRGKFASMAGHGYLHAAWDSMERFPEAAHNYKNNGLAFKITLVVDTDAELENLRDAYYTRCGVSLVVDAGRTVFKDANGNAVPTTVCVGVGPIYDSMISDDIKLLNPLT